MTAPSLQQIPDTWDTVAPTYAEDIGQWRSYADHAIELANLTPDMNVLDVATGPGTIALLAAPKVAQVTAVDFSPGMIRELETRATAAKLGNLHARVMDAQALDLPDASFDVVFCLFGFFFFPDRAKAFAEAHRVLKPGGKLVIGTWTPIERRPLMKVGFDAMAEAAPQFPRPGKGDLQEPAECVREMSAAGFKDVVTHLFDAKTRVESADAYFSMLARSAAPLTAMKKKMGDEAFTQLANRIVAVLRTKITGPTELGAEAIITIGQR